MNFIKIIFQKIWAVVMVLIKFCLFMAVMFAGAWALAPLGTIHSKDIDMSQFNNHPNEMMMNFYKDICVNKESFKNWTDFLSIYIPNHISAHSQFVYQLMIDNFLRQSVQFCLPKKDESLDLAKLKLSKEEEATMRYVAGYVAFSIKKSVRRKTTPEAKAVIKVLDRLGCSNDQDIADDSSLKNYTMHWIMQINRGGLFEVNDEFYSFIKLTEHLARIILNKKLLIQYCGHDIRAGHSCSAN